MAPASMDGDEIEVEGIKNGSVSTNTRLLEIGSNNETHPTSPLNRFITKS